MPAKKKTTARPKTKRTPKPSLKDLTARVDRLERTLAEHQIGLASEAASAKADATAADEG